jgi:rhodanese-related sulfurtransferase
VRTPEEFAQGHIAGAINYNVEDPMFAELVAGLDPAVTYAVYCRSGNRSQVAVEQMTGAGITSIYELADGIVGWEAAGYPTLT